MHTLHKAQGFYFKMIKKKGIKQMMTSEKYIDNTWEKKTRKTNSKSI